MKKKFIDVYGEDELWNYGEFSNCIEYWASKFDYYWEMFSPLIVTEYNNFVLLRYNLMDTDAQFWAKYNGMYRECRSVVLDKVNDCLVLTPFRKFFNLNETEETLENAIRERLAVAQNVEISDKLDGSMQSARYYNGNIVLAGSQALDPALSFRVNLGYSMLTENYQNMIMDNPDLTFVFEFIHNEDKHVVAYSDDQIGMYLIGIRAVNTGKEFSYADVLKMAKSYGVLHTSVFDKTFDEAMNSLDEKSSDQAEGYVINIDGFKIKLKYNDYVKMHHMLKKLVSSNVIIRCVVDGSWDDVRAKMPEAYRADADVVANNVKALNKMMTDLVNKAYRDCMSNYERSDMLHDDRKNFVAYVVTHHKRLMPYLINAYDGKENNYIKNKAGKFLKHHEIKTALLNGTL